MLGSILHPVPSTSWFLALGPLPITQLRPLPRVFLSCSSVGLAFLVCPWVPCGSPAGLEGAPPGGPRHLSPVCFFCFLSPPSGPYLAPPVSWT